jgi:hypothetical protein
MCDVKAKPQKKKVSFSSVIKQKNFTVNSYEINENNIDSDNYSSFVETKILKEEEKHSEFENFNEISFEKKANKFLIEDNFLKQNYKLPTTIDKLNFFKTKDEKTFIKIKVKINSAVNDIKKHKKINRIDGVLYIKEFSQLLILTEFFIFDFSFKNENFILNKIVEIKNINFITLTRNGKKMILHLIEKQNFILEYKNLDKVVSCISASYFYDNFNQNKESFNRRISVIVLNENFDVIRKLENLKNFEEYK